MEIPAKYDQIHSGKNLKLVKNILTVIITFVHNVLTEILSMRELKMENFEHLYITSWGIVNERLSYTERTRKERITQNSRKL